MLPALRNRAVPIGSRSAASRIQKEQAAMKTPVNTPRMNGTPRSRLGWLFLVPILTTPVQAQLPNLNIAVDSICLTWPVTVEECIVVCSKSPTGPWTPVPVPIQEADGQYQAVVRCSDQQKYFRLAKGTCFVDDFEDGNIDDWTVTFVDPASEGDFIVEATCGRLRIHGGRSGDYDPAVMLSRKDLLFGDFALAIDILGWHDEPDAGALVGLGGRLEAEPVFPKFAFQFGLVAFRMVDNSSHSAVVLGNRYRYPMDLVGEIQELPTVLDPGKDYRLVFSAVGREMSVQLHDLKTGTLVKAYSHSDAPLPPGHVAFSVGDYGLYTDFLFDNFIAVGLWPE
ncbi:MAG: hypothetical protein H7A46_12020 [Verrucomicrobiales bacterium]|nr:hypothetical protein [Verrucomicrobiales bacterium]